MTAAFTPGPWKGPCEPDSNFQKGKVTVKAFNDGKVIATLSNTGTGRANARLMAAAPDMFSLLHAVVLHFEGTNAPLGDKAREILNKVQP